MCAKGLTVGMIAEVKLGKAVRPPEVWAWEPHLYSNGVPMPGWDSLCPQDGAGFLSGPKSCVEVQYSECQAVHCVPVVLVSLKLGILGQ